MQQRLQIFQVSVCVTETHSLLSCNERK